MAQMGNRHQNRDRGGGHRGREPMDQGQNFFDPGKPMSQLVDELAEKQADELQDVTSSQLRKFFGEVKDLYRRLESRQSYAEVIEPQFKMLRSKAYYAVRSGGGQQRISRQFCGFISNGTQCVQNEEQFRLFVAHFEAVVGFLYGKGLVK